MKHSEYQIFFKFILCLHLSVIYKYNRIIIDVKTKQYLINFFFIVNMCENAEQKR